MGETFNYSDFTLIDILNEPIIEKINSFSQLEEGWDCGVGVPASEDTVRQAISIYQIGLANDFQVDAFPKTNGDITLNLFVEDNFLYITIKENNTYDIRYEKGFGVNYDIIFEEEDKQFGYILYMIKIFKYKWLSYELYTSENTIRMQEDSKATVSRITVGEYQYSMKDAALPQVVQSVRISPTSTKRQLETQYSFVD